jgi:uncharacterized membrane protein YphA (DoxX/SURF4 family)
LRAQVGGWKGAAIGGVTGAAAGGVAGHLLDKQAAELKKKDIAATRTANGILVHLKNELLFETDSAVLSRRAEDRDGEAVERLLRGFPGSVAVATFPFGGTSMPSDAKTLLQIGYGLVPIVAGADKFTNLLVDWDRYLSPKVERRLPVDGRTFMRLVGVIEIGAGLLVLRRPRVGGAVMAGWFAAIAGNLLSMGKYLDIAARDALLAVGAAALAMMPESSQAMQQPRMPARRMRMDPVGTIPRSVH